MDKAEGQRLKAEVFVLQELRVFKEVERRPFTKPQKMILKVLRKYTFGKGKTRLFIPSLRHLACWADIYKPDASVALRELAAAWVVQENPARWFGINVCWDAWKVPARPDDEMPTQDRLPLEEPPDLDQALRETFVEFGVEVPAPTMPSDQAACLGGRPGPNASAHWQGSGGGLATPEAATGGRGESGEGTPARPGLGDCEPGGGPGQGVRKILTVGGEPAGGSVRKLEQTASSARAGAGFDEGVRKLLTAAGGARRVSPPTPPSSGRLNVERSTFNAQNKGLEAEKSAESQSLRAKVPASTARPKRVISVDQEGYTMDLIRDWLEPQDPTEMARNGGMWRARWVRNCWETVQKEISVGKELEMLGSEHKPKKRAKWLMAALSRANGVRNVSEMPVGPAPR